jgi:hypothetical protein
MMAAARRIRSSTASFLSILDLLHAKSEAVGREAEWREVRVSMASARPKAIEED